MQIMVDQGLALHHAAPSPACTVLEMARFELAEVKALTLILETLYQLGKVGRQGIPTSHAAMLDLEDNLRNRGEKSEMSWQHASQPPDPQVASSLGQQDRERSGSCKPS